jgi:hypothetical protein
VTVEHDPMCPKWPAQFDKVSIYSAVCECESIADIRDDERERAVMRMYRAAESVSYAHDRPATLTEYTRAVLDQP